MGKTKWELCYVRPQVTAGAEVMTYHPDPQHNHVWRTLADFIVEAGLLTGHQSDRLSQVISVLLNDGWEPLSVGGGIGIFTPANPDHGATGYAFRRQLSPPA